MNKIRIGNDIRIDATLRGIDNYDYGLVKQVRAYIINIDSNEQNPIKADVCKCACGNRGYHFYPRLGCGCNPACGPAPLPNRFCYNDRWCHYNRWCCGVPRNTLCRYHDPYFIPDDDMNRYLALSKISSEENKIQIYFPAKDQLECGNYKLIVVVSLYEEGWGKANIRTYTIDYGYIFTLVNDESGGISGYVAIDTDNTENITVIDDDATPQQNLASTERYGVVRLAEGVDDLDDNDVVTMSVLNQYNGGGINAQVEDTTLVFGRTNQQEGPLPGDAADAL